MKKAVVKLISIASVLALIIGSIAGCAKNGAAESKVIKVGASITPHAEILNVIKGELEKKGYTLEVVEFTDYVQPNLALEAGDLDANYFQHQPYLDTFNKENNTHIVSAAAVHYEPYGLYAGKCASLDALPDGGVIAVPNDGANEARALLLLEQAGLITVAKDAGLQAKVTDITSNPKNIEIKEIEAAQLARSLPDVDFAVINGNYAIQAGLNAAKDALVIESQDSLAAKTFANIIAVKEGSEKSDKAKALVTAILSDAVKEFIEGTYEGAVIAVF